MPDVLLPYYRVRVLDPVSGNVLIDPLPHLHQAQLECLGFQPGSVGATQIGSWSLPLYPPGSEGWKAAAAVYSSLAYGQRFEFFDGDVEGGDPKYTGYLNQLPNQLNSYTAAGVDSLWTMQRARTDRNYSFNGSTDTLFKQALKGYSLVYGDDQANTFTGYTNNGTWTTTTDEGLNVFSAGAGGDGLLYTNTSYTNANYSDCVIDGIFHLVCGSTPGNLAEAGIIAAVTDANNLILGQALMKCLTSSLWQIQIVLWTKVASVYTAQKQFIANQALTSGTWRGQVRLFGTQSGGNYTWRVIVNGQDVGVSYTYAATPSGAVGFRSTAGSSAFATYLCFENRTSLFAQGSITAGALALNQKFSKTPNMELANLAATTEGGQWRKNPKAGLNADTMDFGALGTDLSGTVFLEDDVNLVDPSTVGPNAEIPATEIELNAPAGSGNQGSVTWHNITAMKKYGVLSDTSNSGYTADFLGQRATAKAIADKRATPGVAKNLTIIRDVRYASATSPTGMLMRELDKVQVNSPRMSLTRQTVQILGWRISEGQPTMELIGDQFPLLDPSGQQLNLRRMWQQVEALANATGAITGGAFPLVSDSSGNPIIDTSGLRMVWTNLGISSVFVNATGTSTTYTTLPSNVAVTFTLARPADIVVFFFATAWVQAGTGQTRIRTNLVGQSQSGAFKFALGNATNGFGHLYVAQLAAGTYTAQNEYQVDVGVTGFIDQSYIQVFRLGA